MSADTRQSASRNPSNGRQLSFACPLSVQPSMTSMRDHAKQSSASARGEIAPSAGPKGSISLQYRFNLCSISGARTALRHVVPEEADRAQEGHVLEEREQRGGDAQVGLVERAED